MIKFSTMRLLLSFSIFLLASLPFYAHAQQTQPFEVTFYFETADYQDYQVDPIALDQIIAYSQDNPDQSLIVQGHTDNQGDISSNLILSKDRALTIQKALTDAGIDPARIQIKALGERYPLYDNNYAIGRQKNRRVEVFITHEVKDVHITQAIKNKRLLEKMRPAPVGFSITASAQDTFFVTPAGTRVYIPANAFEGPEGQPIQVEIKEAYTFADMLLHGLSTTSNGALLTTGGMFEIKASSGGQPLTLREGKELAIQVPTDSVLPEMQLYELDTAITATNWVNPRPITVPPALTGGFIRTFSHEPACPNLTSLLHEMREPTALELQRDSVLEAFKSYRIIGKKLFAADSIARVVAMNQEKKHYLEGKYERPCTGFFCKLAQLFEGKRAKMARDSAKTKCAQLDAALAVLQTALDKERARETAHRQKIDSSIAVQRSIHAHYKRLQEGVKQEKRSTVQSAFFETHVCAIRHYPKVPDTLRTAVDADRQLAFYYYSKDFNELEQRYPQYEAIIAQHLYQVPTYKQALIEQNFQAYYKKKDLDALQRHFPERETTVCQALYQVDTYEAAKQAQLYQRYMARNDLDGLERDFPEREREVCQQLYQVDTYAAARQEKRERVFMQYCQRYNLEGLQQYFPEREREVCLLLYQVPTFEEAFVVQKRKEQLKRSFYSVQLSNKSLGRWMNLDYLRKLPKEDLLVQVVRVKAPLVREDFLIYSDTKALTAPVNRSSTRTQFKDVVAQQKHTLVSYYAIDDETVALAIKTFDAQKGVAIDLTYESLSLAAFAKRLSEFN